MPIIVISACYDNNLEIIFRQYQKKFAVLSHTPDHNINVKLSDQEQPKKYNIEDLSNSNLLEDNAGYSLIYKINGCLKLSVPNKVNQDDSLVLLEQDYFEFAQYLDKLVPDYLISQLTGRDLWLLSQHKQSWETRFMMQVILEKRALYQQKSRRSHAVMAIYKEANQFDNVYWKAKGVNNYPIDLEEFVARLQTYI